MAPATRFARILLGKPHVKLKEIKRRGAGTVRLFVENSLLRLYASPKGRDILVVMAPSKEDIARLFPDAIVESASDPEDPVYRYRAQVRREHVAGVITERIGAIR